MRPHPGNRRAAALAGQAGGIVAAVRLHFAGAGHADALIASDSNKAVGTAAADNWRYLAARGIRPFTLAASDATHLSAP